MAKVWNLEADLRSADFLHGIEQGFWTFVDRAGARVYMRLYAADGRSYLLELECTRYGDEALLGSFVTEDSHQCVAAAWPRGNGVFQQWIKPDPGNLFICWDQDRAGIGHHGNWRSNEAWKKTGNPLVSYLDFMRQLLNNLMRGYERLPAKIS